MNRFAYTPTAFHIATSTRKVYDSFPTFLLPSGLYSLLSPLPSLILQEGPFLQICLANYVRKVQSNTFPKTGH